MTTPQDVIANARKQVEEQQQVFQQQHLGSSSMNSPSYCSPTATSRNRDVLDSSNNPSGKKDPLISSLIIANHNAQSPSILMRSSPPSNSAAGATAQQRRDLSKLPPHLRSTVVADVGASPAGGHSPRALPAFHAKPFCPAAGNHDPSAMFSGRAGFVQPLPREKRPQPLGRKRNPDEHASYLAKLAVPIKRPPPPTDDQRRAMHERAELQKEQLHWTPRSGKPVPTSPVTSPLSASSPKAAAAAAAAGGAAGSSEERRRTPLGRTGARRAAGEIVPSPPKTSRDKKNGVQKQPVGSKAKNKKSVAKEEPSSAPSTSQSEASKNGRKQSVASSASSQSSAAATANTGKKSKTEEEKEKEKNNNSNKTDDDREKKSTPPTTTAASNNAHDIANTSAVDHSSSQLLEDEEAVERTQVAGEFETASASVRRLTQLTGLQQQQQASSKAAPQAAADADGGDGKGNGNQGGSWEQKRREDGYDSDDEQAATKDKREKEEKKKKQEQRNDRVGNEEDDTSKKSKKTAPQQQQQQQQPVDERFIVSQSVNLLAEGALADLSNAVEYLEVAERNRITPDELRKLVAKLTDAEVAETWYAVVGGRSKNECRRPDEEDSTLVIRKWLRAQQHDCAALHSKLLRSRRRVGVAVMSDSSGLSKLSKTRPLLEVIRLIHEPKAVIAAYSLVGLKGETVGNWVADNTACFFPFSSASSPTSSSQNKKKQQQDDDDDADDSDSAATPPTQEQRKFLDKVLRTVLVAQREIANHCSVQVGIGVHFGTFIQIGDTLQGHEAEHVELLAEDHCAGKEVAVSEPTAKKFFVTPQAAATKFYKVVKREEDDVMKAWRVVPLFSAETSEAEVQSDVLPGSVRRALEEAGVKKKKKLATATANDDDIQDDDMDDDNFNYDDKVVYPAGFGDRFFKFVTEHSVDDIAAAQGAVAGLVSGGIFLLAKLRSVEHDFLLDNLVSRMYRVQEVSVAVKKANAKHAERLNNVNKNMSAGDDSDEVVKLIKCNGDIAILLCSTLSSAISFSKNLCRRIQSLGESFTCSVGGWKGNSYVFPLRDDGKELDVSGKPVNLASKLAEDFGQSGIFFGRDIFEPVNDGDDDGAGAGGAGNGDNADEQELDLLDLNLPEDEVFTLGAVVKGDNDKIRVTPVSVEMSGIKIHAMKILTEGAAPKEVINS